MIMIQHTYRCVRRVSFSNNIAGETKHDQFQNSTGTYIIYHIFMLNITHLYYICVDLYYI